MSCNDNHTGSNCVCEVLRYINELQDCASTSCPTGCDVPYLGANQGSRVANTRVFSLFTKTGKMFKAPVLVGSTVVMSPLFRVESVDEDCCAVLRVLTPPLAALDSTPTEEEFLATFLANTVVDQLPNTGTCLTVDLNCFCGVQCLRDVHVSI